MSDDWLDTFNEGIAVRERGERSFEVLGETLTVKPSLAPQVAIRYFTAKRRLIEFTALRIAAEAEGAEKPPLPEDLQDEALLELMDMTARACLDTATAPAWDRLRSDDHPTPLDWDQLFSLCEYLIGRASTHPTDEPIGSSNGQPGTSPSSEDASLSPAGTPTT